MRPFLFPLDSSPFPLQIRSLLFDSGPSPPQFPESSFRLNQSSRSLPSVQVLAYCMAVNFLNQEISNLCLGKPTLRSLPISSTAGEAVSLLIKSGDSHVSVWACDHRSSAIADCLCVGKVCMADVICFLSLDDNLSCPSDALQSSLSKVLADSPRIVRHLESNSSLLEAIDHVLEGAQNLVVPIGDRKSSNFMKRVVDKQLLFNSTIHNGRQFCWLTQEDIVRFLLNSINIFSPVPTFTIESLNIIHKDVMTIRYHDPASSALASIRRSLLDNTSVGVVDNDNRLIGEICPSTLAFCDITVAAAIATLSAGDLMAYIDRGCPPDDLVQLVKLRLEEQKLGALLEVMEEHSPSCASSAVSSSSSSPCSSDDEFGLSKHNGSGKHSMAKRSEAIVCHPWSSLVAVIIQALAHRTNCVWVVEEDWTLVGIVTFARMLKVFRDNADSATTTGGRIQVQTIT